MTCLKILSIGFMGALLTAPIAQAEDFERDDIKGLMSCFPAKQVVEIDEKLAQKSADRRDVVDIQISPVFKIYDSGQLPDRFFLKLEQSEIDIAVQADGRVPDFMTVVTGAKGQGEICIQDAARQSRPADDEGLYFEMGLTPYYQTGGPRYSYAQLKEGSKDGKSLSKVMLPAVARMFMPDMDYLTVQYTDANIMPRITALKDGNPIGDVTATAYGEGHFFALAVLEDMGADAIEITGPHKLAPAPSIKTMKRFGIGQKKLYPELYTQN